MIDSLRARVASLERYFQALAERIRRVEQENQRLRQQLAEIRRDS